MAVENAEVPKLDKNLSQLVKENAEIAATFEMLEKYSKTKPDVFNYFLQQYQPLFFKGMDLFYLLFGHFSEQQDGLIKRLLPWVTVGMSVVTLIIVAVKK